MIPVTVGMYNIIIVMLRTCNSICSILVKVAEAYVEAHSMVSNELGV